MSANSGKINSETSPEVRDEVIDRLYEVAMDPSRYEELLDHWESMIRPLREGANGRLVNLDLDSEFGSHFVRADKFLEKLGDTPGQINHLHNLDKAAALLIGRDLRLADLNSSAEAALSVQKGDRLSDLPIEPDDIKQLEKHTAAMLMSNSDQARFFRARMLETQKLIVFQLQTIRTDDDLPLVVAVSSALSWPDGFDALLKTAFELTDAEVVVARELACGKSLKTIAQDRNRSVDTVRAQLKSVLVKTETHSQTELVGLTLSMMDIASYTEEKGAEISGESIGNKDLISLPFHVLNLPDGRKMDYLILGDPDGRPCIFFPQDYGLVRWPASAESDAEKRGIKVIVPIRPGYGNSTPISKKQSVGEIFINDLELLITHLKVDKAPILTFGSDVYYALKYHKKFPHRVTAIFASGGTMPLETSAQYERMAKWHRFILASARYTPHLLPFMVKAGFALARRLGKRKFVHAVFGTSAADISTFANPEVYEAMVCGSDVCLSKTHSAHNAFSAEVLEQERTDWGYLFYDIKGKIPVFYLNGLQDPQVPAETLREFQQKHPWINFQIHEDAGQLVFFLKWPEIIPLIEEYL